MKIPWLEGEKGYESVLWDTACSGMLVRTAHAQRMNFPYEDRRSLVMTLGGTRGKSIVRYMTVDSEIRKGQSTSLRPMVWTGLPETCKMAPVEAFCRNFSYTSKACRILNIPRI